MSYADRFKPTALSNMQERKQEVAEATNQFENEGSGIKRKTISEDGTYKIRMYPAHPHESNKQTAMEPKAVRYLPGYVNKRDESGKWIPNPDGQGFEKVLGVRRVLNSKVHGSAPYDLVDTFADILRRQADEKFPNPTDLEAKKNWLLPLEGKFGTEHKGLNLIRTFVFYGELLNADETIGEFHEFEVKPSVQKGLQKLAAVEAGDEPLATDGCFTDVIDGRPFRIKVDSVAGKSDPGSWYSVSIVNDTESVTIDGRKMQVLKQFPISDEKLQWFEEKAPALINYRTCFNYKDLQYQLEGLRIFEEKSGYSVTDTDEFLNVYATLSKLFPVTEEDNDEQEGQASSSTASNKSQDKFDLMDVKELKEYIQTNKLGIRVLPRYTEEDLREMIREVENETEELADDVEEKETSTPVEEKQEASTSAATNTDELSARLAKLKAGLNS